MRIGDGRIGGSLINGSLIDCKLQLRGKRGWMAALIACLPC
jgi:hypothetical protein